MLSERFSTLTDTRQKAKKDHAMHDVFLGRGREDPLQIVQAAIMNPDMRQVVLR